MTRPSRASIALLLTITLHLALLSGLLMRHPQPAGPVRDRTAIQWLLPLPFTPRAVLPPPDVAARPAARSVKRPAERAGATPAAATAKQAAPPEHGATAIAAEPAAPDTAEPVIGDLSAQPATPPVSAAELLRLTVHGAGKIDQELRGGKLAPLPPPGQTLRGKIDAAFEAAHQAVRPKWYEAAKVTEISSPNSRIRVYKIRTALGTYCISMADASMKGGGYSAPSYSNCP